MGAFDDLCDVVETLGDVGQGMGWAKQQEDNLRASKRYLKSDFKVGVTLNLALSLAPDLCLVRPIWHMRSHTPGFPPSTIC